MSVPVLLVVLVVIFRIVLGVVGMPDAPELAWLHNFSPLASVILCGAAFFPRRLAVALPLGALFISDLWLNAHYQVGLLNVSMLPEYAAFGAIAALGLALRSKANAGRLLLGSLAGSVLFYLVTNSAAWFSLAGYDKSLAGWFQALTTGLPGYTPTWLFFRNSLVSDLLFTGLFLACIAMKPFVEKSVSLPNPELAR